MEDFTSEKQEGSAYQSPSRRIQRKREKDEEKSGAVDGEGPGQSEGAKQTQQSLAHIDRVKAQSIENVTSFVFRRTMPRINAAYAKRTTARTG